MTEGQDKKNRFKMPAVIFGLATVVVVLLWQAGVAYWQHARLSHFLSGFPYTSIVVAVTYFDGYRFYRSDKVPVANKRVEEELEEISRGAELRSVKRARIYSYHLEISFSNPRQRHTVDLFKDVDDPSIAGFLDERIGIATKDPSSYVQYISEVCIPSLPKESGK